MRLDRLTKGAWCRNCRTDDLPCPYLDDLRRSSTGQFTNSWCVRGFSGGGCDMVQTHQQICRQLLAHIPRPLAWGAISTPTQGSALKQRTESNYKQYKAQLGCCTEARCTQTAENTTSSTTTTISTLGYAKNIQPYDLQSRVACSSMSTSSDL